MSESENPVTTDHIAAAETLAGLHFTPEERELMLELLNTRVSRYSAIRAAPLDNSVAPALRFHAKPTESAPAAVPRSLCHERGCAHDPAR